MGVRSGGIRGGGCTGGLGSVFLPGTPYFRLASRAQRVRVAFRASARRPCFASRLLPGVLRSRPVFPRSAGLSRLTFRVSALSQRFCSAVPRRCPSASAARRLRAPARCLALPSRACVDSPGASVGCPASRVSAWRSAFRAGARVPAQRTRVSGSSFSSRPALSVPASYLAFLPGASCLRLHASRSRRGWPRVPSPRLCPVLRVPCSPPPRSCRAASVPTPCLALLLGVPRLPTRRLALPLAPRAPPSSPASSPGALRFRPDPLRSRLARLPAPPAFPPRRPRRTPLPPEPQPRWACGGGS